MSRDFTVEMRALLDRHLAGDEPYNAATIASKLVSQLRAQDPDLLAGWLDERAEEILRDAIARIDASSRGHARATGGRQAFAHAFRDHDAGQDPDAMQRFLDSRWTVGEDQLRKTLRSMTRADCVQVAEAYEDRARRNGMQAAFMRAVAKAVTGNRVVGDVLSERRLANMWAVVVGEDEPPAALPAASAAKAQKAA